MKQQRGSMFGVQGIMVTKPYQPIKGDGQIIAHTSLVTRPYDSTRWPMGAANGLYL